MTKMIIDNKARAKKDYEVYEIDRNEYPTVMSLENLIDECMNDEVYAITIMVDDVIFVKKFNNK